MDRIDFSKVLDFWDARDSTIAASVYVGDIIIQAYFFTSEEIENDITPNEIRSLDDHNRLVNYLRAVSHTSKKKVILCSENAPETPLVVVEQNNVTLLPN